MNVLVNEKTLNVANAYAEREVSTGIITYFITLLQSEMDYYDLKELFKSNTGEIVKTDDEGNVELFANAKYVKTNDDDANGLYTVILKTDENAHQLARNRQLESDKASLRNTVASKDIEISNLNGTLAEKDKAIAEREEVIATKDAEIAELLTIAEEYADMVFASLEETEIENLESEVM